MRIRHKQNNRTNERKCNSLSRSLNLGRVCGVMGRRRDEGNTCPLCEIKDSSK